LKLINPKDELIYIDDNSQDLTVEIFRKISKRDKRIKYYLNSGKGLVDALNMGINRSKNEWIARCDVDDVYPNNRLTEQRKYISSEIAAIFCDYEFIDSNNNYLGKLPSAVFSQAVLVSLFNSQRTPHPGVLFSKKVFEIVGGYYKSDFPVEDLSLWIRMSKVGKIISVPETLLYYRIHGKSVTATKRNEIELKRSQIFLKYKLVENIDANMNYLKIWNDYKLIPNFHTRQLLFIWDYYCLLRYKNSYFARFRLVLIFWYKIIFNPIKVYFILKLWREKNKRKKYRQNHL
jgi:glycosyltransferase involved in cell wall biosynthesis